MALDKWYLLEEFGGGQLASIYIPVYKSWQHKFEANNGNCKAKMVFYMLMALDISGSFWKNLEVQMASIYIPVY